MNIRGRLDVGSVALADGRKIRALRLEDGVGRQYPGGRDKAPDGSAPEYAVALPCIESGMPVPHYGLESFDGRLRDESLTEGGFVSVADAWRTVYEF